MTRQKTCTRCSTVRPVSDFYVQNKETGRLNPWCKECYRDWYRSRGGYASSRTARCHWCDVEFVTPYSRAKFCSPKCKGSSAASRRRGNGSRKPDRTCPWCSGPVPISMRADAVFCSEDCSHAAHNGTRKMAKRAGRLRAAGDPLTERAAIAKRDSYRCGICGGGVNMSLTHPDPGYGSLDHILPVAMGGDDDISNLQLAHLRCNLAKGAGGRPTQLRLIG